VGSLLAVAPAAARAQSVTFTFDTTPTPTKTFAPRNIVAVWIEKPNGTFVRTLAQWAMTRKQYLLAWNTSSKGNNVDAVTGATFPAHGTRMVTWDLTDANKAKVPNGMYVVKLELADSNVTMPSQNNFLSYPFTVTGQSANLTTSGGGFNNVKVDLYAAGTAPDMATLPDLSTGGGMDAGMTSGAMAGGCSAAGSRTAAGSTAPLAAALALMVLRGRRARRPRPTLSRA
jgi:hypothetical protein